MTDMLERIQRKIEDCDYIIALAMDGFAMTKDDDDTASSWYTCAELIDLMRRERQRCIKFLRIWRRL